MKKNNFWQKLKSTGKPILALAPMAGFTDSVFRRICKKYGADVLYSEMVSATALYYSDRIGIQKKGKQDKNPTLELMNFNRRAERYYVIQLFGSKPEHFAAAAKIINDKVRPDGIDINFGCPVSKIIKQGAGADLMKNLAKSRAVIEAVLSATDLPVSIKIRSKSGDVSALDFLKNISDLPISAVMIHGRTLNQGFAGACDFKIISAARKYFSGVILANGGINSLITAQEALKESKADGLGLARGVLGRPWLFKEIKKNKQIDLKLTQIFKLIIEQAKEAKKTKGENALIELRKHLVWYVQGLEGASKMREKLVAVSNLQELKKIIKEYKK
ncbi:MAG: tRNA-dihydrouridine synthase [Patescibacteria group bacterium]